MLKLSCSGCKATTVHDYQTEVVNYVEEGKKRVALTVEIYCTVCGLMEGKGANNGKG